MYNIPTSGSSQTTTVRTHLEASNCLHHVPLPQHHFVLLTTRKRQSSSTQPQFICAWATITIVPIRQKPSSRWHPSYPAPPCPSSFCTPSSTSPKAYTASPAPRPGLVSLPTRFKARQMRRCRRLVRIPFSCGSLCVTAVLGSFDVLTDHVLTDARRSRRPGHRLVPACLRVAG